MRYAGQSFELAIPAAATTETSLQRFHERHAATYGYSVPEERVEIVNARMRATAPVAGNEAIPRPEQAVQSAPTERALWFPSGASSVTVYARSGLRDGDEVSGPAIIEQYDACTYVAPRWNAVMRSGDLVLQNVGFGATA
ncbi:MAG: hydantoinase/oxoprolinase family protein, partial [Candidatus Eremiobacteraeota bacterium]|nr:hydantoinase/oxoprolinase family protein [Candidatus Eremiobacteraeota bacterium]